jgi:6-pyruvoyl-tetrahydropterin synthase related domain
MTDLLDSLEPAAPEEWDLAPNDPPPPPEKPIDEEAWRFYERLMSVLVVGGLMMFTFVQMHPSQIFAKTTPAGGDMGAHVWGPAYLRDHILPHGRLSGWAPDWYGGFPMYQFYMVIPALVVVIVNLVLPYGIALKVVSVLGIVTLPFVCWLFGRLNGLKKPLPEVFAVAAVWFLFDDIYGGNIASTMAGEYSFSIALSLAVAFFAVFSYTLRTGRFRVLSAILAALAALSHGIVLFFVAIGAVMLWAVHASVKRLVVLLQVGALSGLLASFWLIPFGLRKAYQTDMHYEKRPTGKTPDDHRTDSWWEMFFPQSTFWDRTIMILAVIGFLDALRRRTRAGAFLGLMMTIYGTWAYLQPQSLLWNARLLPFMYLTRYMLAAMGVVAIVRLIARFISPLESMDTGITARRLLVVSAGLLAFGTCAQQTFHLWAVPDFKFVKGAQRYDGVAKKWVYEWPAWSGPRFVGNDADKGFVSGWADWNYQGYEKKQAYGEYQGLMTTMEDLGKDPAHGCGRAMWENNNDQDKYGTPMAQMLLPFWTDGCIASQEGLFFEASGTTPYHFISAAAMSEHSSNPVRRLKYEDGDLTKGVQYLKTLGVKYYMAYKPSMIAKADAHQELESVATSGPWHIYQIKSGNDLVTPLQTQPLVVQSKESLTGKVSKDLGNDGDRWLEVGSSWFQHQQDWAGVPVANGPAEWQRVDLKVISEKDTNEDTSLAVVAPKTEPEARELAPVKVSNIVMGDDTLNFDVDQIGVPVMVRVSAFPNWKVDGAKGPYRAAPNFMVVVPTAQHVRLHYGYTPMDLAAWLLTFLGIGGAVFLWRRGTVTLPPLDVEPVPMPAEETHGVDHDEFVVPEGWGAPTQPPSMYPVENFDDAPDNLGGPHV